MMLNFGFHPGWTGMFTNAEAPGAYPNGTRIKKTMVETGDAHGMGALGTVIGSIKSPRYVPKKFGPHLYFVEWDDALMVAVGVSGLKIGRADAPDKG